MKHGLLRTLLAFFAVTVPLTWLWMNGGEELYVELFRKIAFPILGAMGMTGFPIAMVRDRMIGFIPFLALMVVTPKLGWLRRAVGIVVGALLLFASHVALSWWAYQSFVRGGKSAENMGAYFPALVLVDALPFLLWALFANRFLRETLSRVLPSAPPPPPDPPGAH